MIGKKLRILQEILLYQSRMKSTNSTTNIK